ncbi:hypothetical protein G6F46_015204 [Rhizopus delemar]|nr:hypothetical protein G6F32_016841 [Rhizopus arrhizus]KAG1582684.1 hypothetical protein G6F46_015204 [Rhizopus delemar]
MVGGEADTAIAHTEADPRAIALGQQGQAPVSGRHRFHRVHRIEDQVADHLLYLYAVGLHRWQVGIQQQRHRHAMPIQLAA